MDAGEALGQRLPRLGAELQARSSPLPLLISVAGELLGPVLEGDGNQSATWYIVPDGDVDLSRLVAGIAELLTLSSFAA